MAKKPRKYMPKVHYITNAEIERTERRLKQQAIQPCMDGCPSVETRLHRLRLVQQANKILLGPKGAKASLRSKAKKAGGYK